MESTSNAAAHPASTGSDWGGEMPPARRLALYLRGGLRCAVCLHAVEEGAQLSLDHVAAHHAGGDNSNENLAVLCGSCNSSKQERPLRSWLKSGGGPRGLSHSPRAVEARILRQAAADLAPYLPRAEQLLRERRRTQRAARKAA